MTTLEDLLPPLRLALCAHSNPETIREVLTRLEGGAPEVDAMAARLVERLGGETYSDRESANAVLREMGPRARGAILAGLESGTLEGRTRCARLLRDHWEDALTAWRRSVLPETASGSPGGRT
ncbi:MAG: hypothetical protein HYY93_06170 [Planctomycetes bacterium]|nr:hypothetical protein [Planctomycetota bacterium]